MDIKVGNKYWGLDVDILNEKGKAVPTELEITSIEEVKPENENQLPYEVVKYKKGSSDKDFALHIDFAKASLKETKQELVDALIDSFTKDIENQTEEMNKWKDLIKKTKKLLKSLNG